MQNKSLSAYERSTLAHFFKLVVVVFVLGLFFWGGIALWNYLEDSGYIYHDLMVVVYSPAWQYGEYKTCTTVNYRDTRRRDILCDGGVPSGRVEDGKVFKARFWGWTYDEGKPAFDPNAPNVAGALKIWTCRKAGGDPAIICKQAPEEKQSNP
jgi:hypothetical protein